MCTAIQLFSKSGAVISARTMEFGIRFETDVAAFAKGTKMRSTESYCDNKGFEFELKHGFLGMASSDRDSIADGVNDVGLHVSVLYYPGYAVACEPGDVVPENAVTMLRFGQYLLASCESIAEVREAIKNLTVVQSTHPIIKATPPCHFVITDKAGASIIVEPDPDGLSVYDNAVRVMTNSPSYPWHLTNLSNNMQLNYHAVPAFSLDNFEVKPFGQGSGAIGLPGDSYPPARFIRATAFVHSVPLKDTSEETVQQAFHILNNFDIPEGSVLPAKGTKGEGQLSDITAWTCVFDHEAMRYYWITFDSQCIEFVDVLEALNGLSEPKGINIETGFRPANRTAEFA